MIGSLILIWLIGVIAVAISASQKGKSALWWAVIAIATTPPMAAMLLLIALTTPAADPPSATSHVRCPDCRELIRRDATVCKCCGCKLATT